MPEKITRKKYYEFIKEHIELIKAYIESFKDFENLKDSYLLTTAQKLEDEADCLTCEIEEMIEEDE